MEFSKSLVIKLMYFDLSFMQSKCYIGPIRNKRYSFRNLKYRLLIIKCMHNGEVISVSPSEATKWISKYFEVQL